MCKEFIFIQIFNSGGNHFPREIAVEDQNDLQSFLLILRERKSIPAMCSTFLMKSGQKDH